MLYVGVDAHKETSHITVMDEDGKVLKRARVKSSRQGVLEALGMLQRAPTSPPARSAYPALTPSNRWRYYKSSHT